jgi:hypothetical protein
MRRLLTAFSFTLLFIFSATTLKAQLPFLVDVGLRGGIASAGFLDSKQDVDSRRLGLTAGGYANINIPTTPFSIQPELLFTQKGAEINGVDVDLGYLEIPVLAKLNFIKTSKLKSYLYLGPYFGFNLSADEDPPSDDQSLEEITKNSDVGLTFGGEVAFGKTNVGLRYGLGLTEIFENEEEKNSTFSVVVGYTF